jgi:hypothetical protein
MKKRITMTIDSETRTKLLLLASRVQQETGVVTTAQNLFASCFKRGLHELSALHNVRSTVIARVTRKK